MNLINKFKQKLKDKNGAVYILMLFLLLVLFIFILVMLEITKFYTVKFEVETNMARLANNAVETNIDDEYRQDGITMLKTDEAKQFVQDYFYTYAGLDAGSTVYTPGGSYFTYGSKNDGTGVYMYGICITSITAVAQDPTTKMPYMEISGDFYMGSSIPIATNNMIMKFPFTIKSENFRTEEFSDLNYNFGV